MGRRKGAELQTPEEVKAKKREWYLKNRERMLAHYAIKKEIRRQTSKQWALDNPEAVLESGRRFKASKKGKEKSEHDSLLRRFREHGLTLDQYHAKIESQDFLCAICREEPKTMYGGSHDGFHIDHHHVTNKVRGLLCDTCNIGIGMLKDSSEVCIAAANYLSSR